MPDIEIDAMSKCTEVLTVLEEDAKIRVLKYLIERFGLNKITPSNPTNPQINSKSLPPAKASNDLNDEDSDFPVLKEVVMKDLPKSEPEWILIYGFYGSSYGAESFNKAHLLEKYKESKRYSTSTSANFSKNLQACVTKGWFKMQNDTDFLLKPDGRTHAVEILEGKSQTKGTKRGGSKKGVKHAVKKNDEE